MILTNTANSSNTTVRELADGLKFAGVVAAQVGMSMEETAAAMGVMSDAGLRGSKSGMGMRQVLADLLAPSRNAVKVLKELGITYDQINPEKVGLIAALKLLKKSGMDTSDAFKLFGARAATAALAMTQNLDKIEALTAANEKAEGVAQRNADLINNTLRGAYLQLISTLQEVMLRIGESGFTGALKTGIQTVTQFIRVLVGIKTESKDVSDNVLRAVVATRKLWNVLKSLKNIIIVIIAIHFSAKLVTMAAAMITFAKATLLASKGLISMAAGIAGIVLPALAVLSVAILALEWGSWIERMEPVQKFMQSMIFGFATLFVAFKKQVSDVWVGMKSAAITLFINPVILAFNFFVKAVKGSMIELAKMAKGILSFLPKTKVAVLALDQVIKQLGGKGVEVSPFKDTLIQDALDVEEQYQKSLRAIEKATKIAFDNIKKFQKEKGEGGSFFDFVSGDIQKLIQKIGLFTDKTAASKKELAKFRAILIGSGDEGKTAFQKINEAILRLPDSILEVAHKTSEWIEKMGEGNKNLTKGLDKFKITWEDMAGTVASGLTDLITRAKGFKDAINDVVDSLVRMAIQAAIMSTFTGGAPVVGAKGLVAMASGGIVSAPTGALLGESGPEAVIPLSRDETGKLGIAGGGVQKVETTFNIISPDSRGVKDILLRDPKLIRQMNESYKQGYAID